MRAGLVRHAAEYPWSSAAAHVTGGDPSGILDMDWWRGAAVADWAGTIGRADPDVAASLRRCTYAGSPFGTEDFMEEMSRRFGRYWQRGRPAKKPANPRAPNDAQFGLFANSEDKLRSSGCLNV